MSDKIFISQKNLDNLMDIIRSMEKVDFRKINLLDEKIVAGVSTAQSTEIDAELLELLRAYQRIVRIMPGNCKEQVLDLLKAGISSASQIAALPRNYFLTLCKEKCSLDEDRADIIYKNAQAKKSNIIIQYVKSFQNSEPHVKAAKFN